MFNRQRRPVPVIIATLLLLSVVLSGRSPATAQQPDGVTAITGSLALTNPRLLDIISEPYVLLADMTAFVERDRQMPLPLGSQIVAPFVGDLATGATFSIQLPIDPQGQINDVDHGEGPGEGVQIYSVEFAANSYGDPFLEETEFTGWGEGLSSLIVTIGHAEVVGGAVVVWAPDDEQMFSSGFGPDGLFLTEDDPVTPIPAGWTVVDLNEQPFTQVRTPEAAVTIEEGDDGFIDLSQLSFTGAFIALIDELELRYPFTEEKDIDWTALRREYLARVVLAEQANDLEAFNAAISDFTLEFNDGHVGASASDAYIDERIGGTLGMRLAELDNGDVIVISVTEGLPADEAGIELGATILEWNGQEVLEAVENEPLLNPASTDHALRLQQYALLTLGPLDEEVTVTFANPDDDEETVDLTFAEDAEFLDFFANLEVDQGDANLTQLPVDAMLLDSFIGYIRINTFNADSVMMTTAWNQAINTLNSFGVFGLIIDVRDNGGGSGGIPLRLAGSFYDEPFELNRTLYIDEDGEKVDIGGESVVPTDVQWDAPVTVLIDESCASACEIFAAAMSEDPDHLIVGYTPTAGVEAGIYAWSLPGDIRFQASIVRMERDGELFVEGVGVPPNVEVEWTEENLLNPEDEVLQIAQEAMIPQIRDYLEELEAQDGAATETAEAEPEITETVPPVDEIETPEPDTSPDSGNSPADEA